MQLPNLNRPVDRTAGVGISLLTFTLSFCLLLKDGTQPSAGSLAGATGLSIFTILLLVLTAKEALKEAAELEASASEPPTSRYEFKLSAETLRWQAKDRRQVSCILVAIALLISFLTLWMIIAWPGW